MTKVIKLGTGVVFDADDAVTQIFGFIARRGAGKTYACSVLVEGLLEANHQVIVFDPIGNWYGLRLSSSGKREGFDIPVFGGDHGDVPLTPESGALIADVIVERGVSAVLDVSHFRKGKRKKFVTDFFEQLFHRKKKARSPLHVVLEESQVFAPQRVMADEARMLGAVEDVVRLGRNYGIGASLISQRPQSVNKEVLNQVECLVALQTNGAQERKALRDWATSNTDTKGEAIDTVLPSLPIGRAVVWSPQWLRVFESGVKISKKKTYDGSATPKVGAKRVEPRPLSSDDLETLEAAMVEVVEEAASTDVKALQKKIRKLESEALVKAAIAKVKTVEIPVVSDDLVQELSKGVVDLQVFRDDVDELKVRFEDILGQVQAAMRATKLSLAKTRTPRSVLKPSTRKSAPKSSSSGELSFRKGARKMLAALCTRESLTRQQISTISGMSIRSSTFSTYLSELKAANMVFDVGHSYSISGEGEEYLESIGEKGIAANTPAELRALWVPKFRAGGSRMLAAIIDAGANGLDRDELSDCAGISITSSTFSTYLGELRKNGLVTVDRGGHIIADDLFLS